MALIYSVYLLNEIVLTLLVERRVESYSVIMRTALSYSQLETFYRILFRTSAGFFDFCGFSSLFFASIQFLRIFI